jgi:hypothetical protein
MSLLFKNSTSTKSPIGTVRLNVTGGLNANSDPSGDVVISDDGVYLKADRVYLKSEYPELHSQIGSVIASQFTPRQSGVTSNLNAIAHYNDLYVAAGANATAIKSEDAVTWSLYDGEAFETNILAGINSNDLFVVAGAGGLIRTSTDGISWQTQVSNRTQTLQSIAYGNGLYVVGGASGSIVTSTDGVSWTVQTSGTASIIRSLAYGNNTYVYGTNGTNTLCLKTSTDGVTWTGRTFGTVTQTINDLTFGGGPTTEGTKFVAGTEAGNIGVSSNGVVWTVYVSAGYPINGLASSDTEFVAVSTLGRKAVSTNGYQYKLIGPNTTSAFNSSVFGNNLYVAAGTGGQLFTSTDAVEWTARVSGTASIIRSLAYGNGLYVYGTNGSTTLCLKTSTDGVTWVGQTYGATATIAALTFGDNLFVAGNQVGAIRTSPDAVTWTARTSGTTSSLTSLMYANGLYVYAGYGGALGTSTDAITWIPQVSNTTQNINALAYENGVYVYGGADGTLATSTDASTWTSQNSGTVRNINALSFSNNVFIYAGDGGVVATSTNAINWQLQNSSTTTAINTLMYGNGQFVASGANGLVSRSLTEGVAWSGYTTQTLQGASYYNGRFFAYGTNGDVLSSTDGLYWSRLDVPTRSTISTVIYGNDLYVAGGFGGYVATTSDVLDTWSSLPHQNSLGISNEVTALSSSDDKFIAAGSTGQVRTSTDGQTWIPASIAASLPIREIFYDTGLYLLSVHASATTSTSGGTLYKSADGVRWEQVTVTEGATTAPINGFAYGNGLYMYVGTRVAGTSTDGNIWVNFARGTITYRSLTFANELFVAGTQSGTVETTSEGIIWNVYSTGLTTPITSLFYDSDKAWYVAVSNNQIRTSTNLTDWVERSPYIRTGTLAILNEHVNADKLVLVGNGGTILSSDDISSVEYSPIYNTDTEFYVPAIAPVIQFQQLDTNTPSEQTSYIKAKL